MGTQREKQEQRLQGLHTKQTAPLVDVDYQKGFIMTKTTKENIITIVCAIATISLLLLFGFGGINAINSERCKQCHVERYQHPYGKWRDCKFQYREEKYLKQVEDRAQWQN